MKKSVIIFQNSFWGKNTKTSGGETRFVEIFSRIQNNFDGVIITNKDGRNLDETYKIKFKYIITPTIFDRFGAGISYLLRTAYVLFHLPNKNIDVVYSNSDFFPDVIPAFVLKLLRPKIKWVQCVFHIYQDWRVRPGNKIINLMAQLSQRISLMLIRKANIVININKATGVALCDSGIDSQKIFINPVGIDYERIQEVKKIKNQVWDAIYLGRINPSKGVFDLPEIWKTVIDTIPNAKLAIIGGGDINNINKLKDTIEKYNIKKNIKFFGYLRNEDIYPTLKSAKIFVFPSHEEGFGIVIAEAMACGLPVISWDLPVYKEVFEGKNISIPLGNTKKFSATVIEYLNSKRDRVRIGRQGANFIKKYSWEDIAKTELNLIEKYGLL
ncbi:MAG TPA: glycosyltransferase [Candidatus Woesebacteria bacterium]|nr:glycosyltransferase [Candidatus Woesebacteria bacterium]